MSLKRLNQLAITQLPPKVSNVQVCDARYAPVKSNAGYKKNPALKDRIYLFETN
jgi:hypothetical protein